MRRRERSCRRRGKREEKKEDDDDSSVRVPSFVVSLLKGGHMISGASVLTSKQYFPGNFLRQLIRAAVPSVCLAVVDDGEEEAEFLLKNRITNAIKKRPKEMIEGFCFAHGYTKLHAIDYYCVECGRSCLTKV